MAKINPSSLKAILQAERADALAAAQASKLSSDRSDAMDYYLGDMSKDMPSPDGRSSAVSTDVQDTVEGLMPALMEIFAGSDEVVRFEPVGPEDVRSAEQESDYVNHVFMQQNNGFIVLHDFIKDQLLQKTGIVKVFIDESETEDKETYYDKSDDEFALIAQEVANSNGGLELVEHTPKTEEDGTKHDITIRATKKQKKARVMGVPPEEFGIERNARDIPTANYMFHEPPQTVGGLIALGYDEEQVKSLVARTADDDESDSRNSVDENESTGDSLNIMARPVKVTEHYIRLDMEGNKKPCIYRVTTGGEGGDILRRDGKEDIVRQDEYPFAGSSPVRIPHRFFGRSIADLVMDIQRIKTALLRGGLDSIYLSLNPRVEVPESHAGPNTLDDLLVSRPGGIVRTKQPGGLQWQVVPDITGSVYPALEYFDATREWRTGVTKQGQGIDANALQNQSATAVNQAFTAAQARTKLIARIIAETGIRDIFSLLHTVLRKHGGQQQVVRLRNQWVPIDPRNWKTRNDMTINVGLGDGGKAQQMAMASMIANFQKELVLGGKVNLVDDAKLYNSASWLARLAGQKNPDLYFNNPNEKNEDGTPKYPPPQPQPDPQLLKVQADAQLKQAELQQRGQELQAKAVIDQQADERKAQIESVQAQADIATQDRKTQADMMLAQQKFEFEKEIRLLEFQLEREKHAAELEMRRELHQQQLQAGAFKVAAGAEAHQQKMQQSEARAE